MEKIGSIDMKNSKVLAGIVLLMVCGSLLLGPAAAWDPSKTPGGAKLGLHNMVPDDEKFKPQQNIPWLTWSRQSLFDPAGIYIDYSNPQTAGIYNSIAGTKAYPWSANGAQANAYTRTQFDGLDIVQLPQESGLSKDFQRGILAKQKI